MNKYFKTTDYKNGDIMSMLIMDLYNNYKYKNILFVRTSTTGGFLDKLLINNTNITRILCDTHHLEQYTFHKSTNIIEQDDLENTLKSINKRFDLICIDLYHEYTHSKKSFEILLQYLSNVGVIVSHDCFPPNKDMATPKFIPGGWCGETYLAFIEFAYNNPDLFYGILKIDTGIGIISKVHFKFLQNKFDTEKQKQLLLHNDNNKDDNNDDNDDNNNNDTYTYFCENCKDVMNIIYFEPVKQPPAINKIYRHIMSFT